MTLIHMSDSEHPCPVIGWLEMTVHRLRDYTGQDVIKGHFVDYFRAHTI